MCSRRLAYYRCLFSKPMDRMVLSMQPARDALRNYARGDEDSVSTLSDFVGECSERDRQWVQALVDGIRERDADEYEHRCPTALKRLLLAISMATPVSGFVLEAQKMQPLLRKLGNGDNVRGDATALSLLSSNCPCLLDLMYSDWWPDGPAPPFFRPLLLHLGTMVTLYLGTL
jgi:hypothetical protein